LIDSLKGLAKDVEFPFINILIGMESRGVKVDIEKLKLLEREFNGILSRLRDNIYILTDSQFNINSPKQLGEILFVKMALKGGKRGRSGY